MEPRRICPNYLSAEKIYCKKIYDREYKNIGDNYFSVIVSSNHASSHPFDGWTLPTAIFAASSPFPGEGGGQGT